MSPRWPCVPASLSMAGSAAWMTASTSCAVQLTVLDRRLGQGLDPHPDHGVVEEGFRAALDFRAVRSSRVRGNQVEAKEIHELPEGKEVVTELVVAGTLRPVFDLAAGPAQNPARISMSRSSSSPPMSRLKARFFGIFAASVPSA